MTLCLLHRCLRGSIALLGLAAISLPLAAQPANDECSNALPIVVGVPVAIDTTAATNSLELWPCADDIGGWGGDVWLRYTPTAAGLARVTICIPPNDDFIAAFATAYTSCGGEQVACDPVGDPVFSVECSQSQVLFPVAAGMSYFVRVAGYDTTYFDTPRPAVGTANIELVPPVMNDTCATATPVGEGVVFGDNRATLVDSPFPGCADSDHDVWYRYTAGATGPVRFDFRLLNRDGGGPFSLFFGGIISVFGTCDGASLACGQEPTINAIAGQSYLVRVAVAIGAGAPGHFPLRIARPPPEGSSDCALPRDIGLGSHPFSNITASQTPVSCGPNSSAAYKNIYFRYTAMTSGVVAITTPDADFTVLKNVTSSCANITCRSDGRVALIDALAGNSYLIHVFSPFNEDNGWAVLNLETLAPPGNDSCGSPIDVVEGSPQDFSTLAATTSGSFPCGSIPDGGVKDVWYRYVAPSAGTAVFSTGYSFEGFGNPDFGITLAAFDQCSAAPFACSTNQQGNCSNCTGSSLSIPVISGQTVLIRVAGTTGRFANLYNRGVGRLSVTLATPPSNDRRSSAADLLDGPNPFSTLGATTDGLAGCAADSGFSSNDVWFTYLAPDTQLVSLLLCGDFPNGLQNAMLSVLDQATDAELACSGARFHPVGGGSCFGRTEAVFNAIAGRRYLVRVAGDGGASGAGVITVTTSVYRSPCLSIPPDASAEAEFCGQQINAGCFGPVGSDPQFQDIVTPSAFISGTTRAEGGSRDIDWYRFVLPSPSVVRLDVAAEFPANTYLLADGCPFTPLTSVRSLQRCEPSRIEAILPAGRWGIYIAHDPNDPNDSGGAFFGLPCSLPNRYLLRLDAQTLGACCLPTGCILTDSAACSQQFGRFSGTNTSCPSATYTQSDSASTFQDISSGNTPLPIANNSGQFVDLGFSFNFAGRLYTSIGISDNGYVAFGDQPLGIASNPDQISSVSSPANAIFAMWDDFDPAQGGIFTRSEGSPGQRRFTVSWQNMLFAGFDPTADSFQLVLMEGSNQIELRYGELSDRSAAPTDVTVGIKDLQGLSIVQVPSTFLFPAGGPAGRRALTLAPSATSGACGNNPCRGDFNNDGDANVNDIFDYLACFFSAPACLIGDRNGNGEVGVQDLLDFLVDWFRGC